MTSKLRLRLVLVVLLGALALFTVPISGQTGPALPLAGMGPYAVGFHLITLKDASRDERGLLTYIWYPAIAPTTPTDKQNQLVKTGWFDATPDSKAAPYPLIIFSP